MTQILREGQVEVQLNELQMQILSLERWERYLLLAKTEKVERELLVVEEVEDPWYLLQVFLYLYFIIRIRLVMNES